MNGSPGKMVVRLSAPIVVPGNGTYQGGEPVAKQFDLSDGAAFQTILMEMKDIRDSFEILVNFFLVYSKEILKNPICNIDCYNLPECDCGRCQRHCKCTLVCGVCGNPIDPIADFCTICS